MTASENSNQTTQNDSTAQDASNSVRDLPSPGALLRSKRENSELNLEDIARDLNLDPWMLHALEADEFSKFGAQVFAKGHLKHYAEHLGLNPDDVLFSYYQIVKPNETNPVIKRNLSATGQGRSYASLGKWFVRLLALLAIGALLYAAVYIAQWWLKDARESEENAALLSVPDTSQVLSSNAPGTSSSTSIALPGAATEQQDGMNLQDTQTLELDSVQVSDRSIQNGTDQNVPDSDIPALNGQETIENAQAEQVDLVQTLRFDFAQSSWVEVSAADGKRLIYGMAKQGAIREIEMDGPIEIFLGNAEGTRIFKNDQLYQVPDNAKAGRTARFVIEPDS